MTKLQNAYNEFIADFCERHGECQATRDEAHEIADRMSDFGIAIGKGAKSSGVEYTQVENMIESLGDVSHDERFLIFAYARAAYDA